MHPVDGVVGRLTDTQKAALKQFWKVRSPSIWAFLSLVPSVFV